MNCIIEADEFGTIHLAGDLVGAGPNSRFELYRSGPQIVLRPVSDERPLWERLSPEERAKDFLDWVGQQQPAPIHLSDEDLRRENLYE